MICTDADCEAHYACRLRAKGIAVAPSATPNRTANRPRPFRKPVAPSWERGAVTEARVDGSRMPYLGSDGRPIRVKAWGENRRQFEGRVKQLKSDPTVFSTSQSA